MKIFSVFYITILTLILASSCKSNGAKQLIGHWELVEAQRADKPTSTLQGLYFEFNNYNELTTNLFGEESDFQYHILDDETLKLVDEDNEMSFKYKVNQSVLNMMTTREGMLISLKFKKKILVE